MATVYFPIGVSAVTGIQNKVVAAVANAISQNDEEYVLTGWADNYTGNSNINTKLREQRAANVKKALVRNGVAANRLETTINDNNLTNFGAKSASMDRAVTIQAK